MKKCYDNVKFIKKAREVHGDKYDYLKVNYINAKTKVCIICPKHGEFWQTPSNHLAKQGCPKCRYTKSSDKIKTNLNDFINKSKLIHGDKYNYSKVKYINNKIKICIICPEHGEFWQTPDKHILRKQGCPSCSGNKKKTTKEFIQESNIIHNNKYCYDKSVYKNNNTLLNIKCSLHGDFKQRPKDHLSGQGCPICNESKLENRIWKLLNENDISFIPQYNTSFLKKQRLDFYLPDYKIAIECQGIQHFKPIDFAGKGDNWSNYKFFDDLKRDKEKFDKCDENAITILYIANNINTSKIYNDTKYNFIYNSDNMFSDVDKLIKKIESIKINSLIKQK